MRTTSYLLMFARYVKHTCKIVRRGLKKKEKRKRDREKSRERERYRSELQVNFQARLHSHSKNFVFCVIMNSFHHDTIGLTDFRLLSPDNCTSILRKRAKLSRCWYRRYHMSGSSSVRVSNKEAKQNKIRSREEERKNGQRQKKRTDLLYNFIR